MSTMLPKMLPQSITHALPHDKKSGAKIDPRVKRTRQLLQKALIDLLHDHEFHTISVQDITARAEVNRATFYAHFEDKYALLNYLVRDMFHATLNSQLPEAPSFTLANLRILLLGVVECLGKTVGSCSPAANHDDHLMIMAQVQAIIYEMIVSWLIQPGQGSLAAQQSPRNMAPDSLAMMTSWVIFGAACQWTMGDHKTSVDQLVDQVLPLLASGLQPYLAR